MKLQLEAEFAEWLLDAQPLRRDALAGHMCGAAALRLVGEVADRLNLDREKVAQAMAWHIEAHRLGDSFSDYEGDDDEPEG